MGIPIVGAIVIGALTLTGGFLLYKLLANNKEETKRTKESTTSYGSIRYSNPLNNHDDSKYKHGTQDSARREISRMEREDYSGSNRLVEYYNKETKGWYVGRKKYDDY